MIFKFVLFPQFFQFFQIILPENSRHYSDRKEKLSSFIFPQIRSIKSSAKRDHMKMRMIVQSGSPCMKNTDMSDLCIKVFWIGRKFHHCLMCGMVECIIKKFLVAVHQRIQFFRHCEHCMKIKLQVEAEIPQRSLSKINVLASKRVSFSIGL